MLDEIARELKASLDLIARDEARLGRVEIFLQARKDQTLRQVAGLLRGVEQACRDGAAQGLKTSGGETLVRADIENPLWPRAMAA